MYSMRATAKLWGQVGALEDIVTTGGNKQCLHSFTHKSGSCGTWYSFQVKLHVWLEQWKMTFIPVGLVSFIVSMNSNAWVTLQGVQGATLGLQIFFNTLQTLTLKSLTQWDHIPLKKQKHLISHSWMLRHGPWVLNFDSLFYILSFIFSRSSICCLVSLYLYYNVTSTSVQHVSRYCLIWSYRYGATVLWKHICPIFSFLITFLGSDQTSVNVKDDLSQSEVALLVCFRSSSCSIAQVCLSSRDQTKDQTSSLSYH